MFYSWHVPKNLRLCPALFSYILKNGYSLSTLLKDVSAGLTVGVVALPLALAFAIASGLTPDRGLYTVVGGALLMAMLSGSRFQVCGPTGAFVVIIYNIVQRHGYDGLVITTLMAGALLIVFGLLRLGVLIKFIPYPVTTGFTTGIALLIFTSQVKDFFGLPLASTPPEFFDKLEVYGQHALSFSPATLGVGAFTLLILLLVRCKIPRIPAPVVGVILASLLVGLFGLPVDTIGSRFGAMPSELPDFRLPEGLSFERIRLLFPDALTIALLAGIESLLSCVVADSMSGERHDANMELVAQGAGNIASIFFGGFAATGAIARTATNVRAGAVTPVSALVHVLVVMAFILWLAPLAAYIPLASLAAILVLISWDMSDLRNVRQMFKGPKSDWAVMLLTFALTVVIDLTVAVYTGVILASMLFMHRMSLMTRIGTADAEHRDVPDVPLDGEDVPEGVQVFTINGPFFFGVADRFQNVIDAIQHTPKVFILYLHNVPAIDATAIHALESFLERRGSTHILLADLRPQARKTLDSMGLLRRIGPDNVFNSLHAAIEHSRELLRDQKQQG